MPDSLLPAFFAAAVLHAAALGWIATRPDPPPPRVVRGPTQVRLVARTPAPAPPRAPEPRPASVVPPGRTARPPPQVALATPAPTPRGDPPAPAPPPRRFAVSMDAVVPGGGGGVAVPVTPGQTAPRGDPGLPSSAPVGDNPTSSTADVTEVERAPVLLRQPSSTETRALYPETARREGIEADVGLELLVSEGGEVAEVRVVRGAGRGFDEVARQLGRRLRFRPAERGGRAVAVWIPWTWKFRLDG